MRKEDKIFIGLVIISNIFGWVFLYYVVNFQVEKPVITQDIQVEDSIKSEIDSTYPFDHSQIK